MDRITPDEMRRRYNYFPESGLITHKSRDDKPEWRNRKYAGSRAFTTESTFGYLQGIIDGKSCSAHIAAWCLHYNEWPDGEVDHIDRDRKNNRIANLRVVSRSENVRNRGTFRNNRSGYTGVYYRKRDSRWIAYINRDGKRTHLGYHNCVTSARIAYALAANMYESKNKDRS